MSTPRPSGLEFVTGVVDPQSPSGGRGGSDWRLHFALEVWHREDQVIVSVPLRVTRDVGLAELESLMARVRPGEIFSARVRFDDPHTAQLVEILEPQGASDALVQRAADLLVPKTFVDGRFGVFTLDRRMDWYEGNASWCGRAVPLYLNATNEVELDSVIRTTAKLWDEQLVWSTRLEDCAIEHLLELKNDCWLDDDDEQRLEPHAFRRRMTLESVTVEADGSFEFWFDDGDLFGGHAIRVEGNVVDGATRASIQG